MMFTWDGLIDVLGPMMLDEANEPSLRKALSDSAWRQLLDVPDGGWNQLSKPDVRISQDSWGRVLVQLRALGVIETGTKKRTVSDKAVYWRLTPTGDQYLVRLKAIPHERPSEVPKST